MASKSLLSNHLSAIKQIWTGPMDQCNGMRLNQKPESRVVRLLVTKHGNIQHLAWLGFLEVSSSLDPQTNPRNTLLVGLLESGNLQQAFFHLPFFLHFSFPGVPMIQSALLSTSSVLILSPTLSLSCFFSPEKRNAVRTSLVVQQLRIHFTCQCRGHGFNPWSGKIPHAVGQLSLCATTTVSWVPQSPCSITREATAMKSPCAANREQPSLAVTRESP